MNIAFLLGQKFPKLSETFILNQITGLIEQGHCVDIYANKPSDDPKIHPDVEKYKLLARTNYRVDIPKNYSFRFIKGLYLASLNFSSEPSKVMESINIFDRSNQASEIRSLRFLYEIIPFLNKPNYDVIQCHFGHNGLKCLNLRKYGVLQGKLVTTFHGSDITKALKNGNKDQYNKLFEDGDLFLPVSEAWREKLIILGCDPEKIIVHHMGVDCDSFTFKERTIDSNQTINLVTVSRLVEKKGVEYGIRAVAELAKRNLNVHYKIVGDGPLRSSLNKLISDLNVEKFVHLLGWQDKSYVVDILENSHIMLAPSVTSKDGDQEGIPVALMEAMAIGIPVVSTFHSGIPELIENGISGLLVDESDIDKLAHSIELLIFHPDLYAKVALSAHLRIKQAFDIKKLNAKLEVIFKSLLKDS